MTTNRFADCCVVRAPLSRHDSSDHGTRPVSVVTVTCLRVGPDADVVDEDVAVRSWVQARAGRRARREAGSRVNKRSDCMSAVNRLSFNVLVILTFKSSTA